MIPETFDRLRDSERGVSPVIGVILMVAITVILAAVIAAFVLGFGAGTEAPPQASISMDVTDNESGGYNVTLEHNGGDTIDVENLVLRGSGVDGADLEFEGDEFRNGDVLELLDESEISEGTINLIWESGDESHRLASTDV